MTKYLLILFLLSPSISSADWTKIDTAFQVGYSILHVIDWGTTRDISKNPDRFHENNPILGKHPSVGKVDTYFIATLIGHTTVSYLLPDKLNVFGLNIRPRRTWQVGWIGIEGWHIRRNIKAGVKINF